MSVYVMKDTLEMEKLATVQTLMNVILAMNATVMPHAQIAQAAILASTIMASQETDMMETSQISTSVQAMNHLYTTVTPMPPVQILHQTSLALVIWVILGMAPIVRILTSVQEQMIVMRMQIVQIMMAPTNVTAIQDILGMELSVKISMSVQTA
jgi:hypothetical protein